MPKKRILIVDDEESIQTVVQFGIQMMVDWEVLVASSGMQGIKTACDQKPDAILLDVMMLIWMGLLPLKLFKPIRKLLKFL